MEAEQYRLRFFNYLDFDTQGCIRFHLDFFLSKMSQAFRFYSLIFVVQLIRECGF
jgi:hypothetical protein